MKAPERCKKGNVIILRVVYTTTVFHDEEPRAFTDNNLMDALSDAAYLSERGDMVARVCVYVPDGKPYIFANGKLV